MDLNRTEARVLRELMRAGEAGLDRRAVLTAMYIKWENVGERVRKGMGHGYVQKTMARLRLALEEVGHELVVLERVQRHPRRWALLRADREEAVPGVPLAHVVPADALRAALAELPRLQGTIVRHLAAAGERGLAGGELLERVYPVAATQPLSAPVIISVSLRDARPVLARHGLAVVTRPTGGPRSRRYLVRTR